MSYAIAEAQTIDGKNNITNGREFTMMYLKNDVLLLTYMLQVY